MSVEVHIPASQLTHLGWCCKRCGKDDGVARSNVPLGNAMEDEGARRALLGSLVQKVLNYHAEHDGCQAAADDIFFQPRELEAAPERIH